MLTSSCEIEGFLFAAMSVTCQNYVFYFSMVPIATLIMRIPIERVVGDQALFQKGG
jgi:hypothetical protein